MESEFKIPSLPPMPSALESKTSKTPLADCPPCQYTMPLQMQSMHTQSFKNMQSMEMMYPMWEKTRFGGGNSTFFLMLIAAAFFATGIWLSTTLKNYAPGGSNENAQTFTTIQVVSTVLISGGVLVLVIAWFTGK
jgi:hypothetical protein